MFNVLLSVEEVELAVNFDNLVGLAQWREELMQEAGMKCQFLRFFFEIERNPKSYPVKIQLGTTFR